MPNVKFKQICRIYIYQENKGDCKEEDALSDLYFERGKQSFNFVAEVLVFGAFQLIVFFKLV